MAVVTHNNPELDRDKSNILMIPREELRHRLWDYENNRYLELQKKWDKEALGKACQILDPYDKKKTTIFCCES